MLSVDINCDMGESSHLRDWTIDQDLAMLPYVSAVNLACGFHAGDAHTMRELVGKALEAGKAIGAHPSFMDRENFGRVPQVLSPDEIYELVLYQVGALGAFLKVRGARLHHVKPHGALYNMAAQDEMLARMICSAVADYDPQLVLYGLSGSVLATAAAERGLAFRHEVFADRSYQASGQLTPRSEPGAVLHDQEQVKRQVLQMVQQGTVTATNGVVVPVQADTICVHGDGATALALLRVLHELI